MSAPVIATAENRALAPDEDKIRGWKGIAAELGVSVTKTRALADPYVKIHLPVFWDWDGPFVTREDLEWWKRRYRAPHGFHKALRENLSVQKKPNDEKAANDAET